jgi:magnesium-transporting ATPase (P-type)
MQRPTKIIWGLATILPIFLTLVGFISFFVLIVTQIPEMTKTPPDPHQFPTRLFEGMILFYGMILVGVVLGFLIVISYFIHMVRTERLNKDQRTMWAVLFVVFRTLAMIVYWFIHVWPEGENEDAEEVATPRRRRKI